MNNEPVAYVDSIWMDRPDLVMSHQLEIGKLFARTQFTNYVPLYTHPAKELDEQFKKGFESGKEEGWKAHKFHHPAKTLTDEEILDLCPPNHSDMMNEAYTIDFARAILRKAQGD